MEDKLGIWGSETVGTLSTAADYRVIFVKLKDSAKLCAEAPADAAAQFSSALAAALSGQVAEKEVSAQAQVNMALAMKQLFKRSQGVQLYRDSSFALCNMYLNGALTPADYLAELKSLRQDVAKLIEKEIPVLDKVAIDPIAVPMAPTPQADKSGG